MLNRTPRTLPHSAISEDEVGTETYLRLLDALKE